MPDYMLRRLQLVQNTSARLIMRLKKFESITPALIKLHWLPIKYRIQFKILLLCYKAIKGESPQYMSALLTAYIPSRNLRSSTKNLLVEPPANLKRYGERAFSVAAPKLWNALPEIIKSQDSINSYKSALKTHLFKLAFNGDL